MKSIAEREPNTGPDWAEGRIARAAEIFGELLDAPPEQRSSLLAVRCAGDDQLKTLVAELLANDQSGMGDFLQWPSAPTLRDPPTPMRVGSYRIVRELGRGGAGVVYEALQDHPARSVALKLIGAGRLSADAVRRFRHEAEILGTLQHPGIAQIYEAGAVPLGGDLGSAVDVPYIAMELVRGEALTRAAAGRGLNVNQRVELLARVCDAVQHAHQKGVIHRDLKPGNILLADEPQATPKVLDFGIARATGEDFRTLTMQTEEGQLLGTVPYMSPEQLSGNSRLVDTRSDVYSLGVVLFELLSGELPHDVARRSLAEAMQIVRDQPPRSLRSVNRSLDSELETICAKALRREPGERYQSAADLAADLRRFLRGEPIEARRDALGYVIRKQLRRHWLPLAVVSAFVLTLAGGLVTTLSQWRQAEAARGAESEQRARAVAINDLLKEMLEAADPAKAKGAKLTVREALDSAAKRIEENPPKNQPLVEAEVRFTIGSTYLGLGSFAEAEAQLRAADALQTRALGDQHPDTLRSRSKLAEVLSERTDYAGAAELARPTMEAQTRVLGPDHLDTLRTTGLLGNALAYSDQYAEGVALLQSAIERRTRVQGPSDPDTARTMNVLGGIYVQFTFPDKAEPLHRESLRIFKQALGEDHPDTLNSAYYLATALDEQNRLAEAESLLRSILEPAVRVWGPDHIYISQIRGDIAAAMEKQGRAAEAEVIYREVIADLERLGGPADFATLTIKRWLAGTLAGQKRYGEAEVVLRAALQAASQKYGPEHSATTVRIMSQLAGVLAALGKDTEVEQLARAVIDVQRRQTPRAEPFELRDSYGALVRALQRRGAKEEALRFEQELHEWLLESARKSDANQGAVIAAAMSLIFPINPELRDPALGLELARRGDELSQGQHLQGLRTLARAYVLNGDGVSAAEVWERIAKMLPDDAARAAALNGAAWTLLTITPEANQNPEIALRLAQRASDLTNCEDPGILDTLALAHHRNGDNSKALETQEKALRLLAPDSPDRAQLEARLVEYQAAIAPPAPAPGQ